MKTDLYEVDKADDQIIGSMTQMLESMHLEFEHTTARNYVEARWDFDQCDEENFDDVFEDITLNKTVVDYFDWTFIETEFTYVFAITYMENLTYNIS